MIAALERKVGQLTMEIGLFKKTPLTLVSNKSALPSIITGSLVAAFTEDAKS